MKAIPSIAELLGNVVHGNTVSYVNPKPNPAPTYAIHGRGNAFVSQDDLQAAAPVIYGEVSNRPPEKQALESRVILNTAINRMQHYALAGTPKTLAEVLSMPNQYQAYGSPQYKAYGAPGDPLAMKKKQQIDAILSGIMDEIKTKKFSDNTQGAFYYKHNPDGSIAYDDTRPLVNGQKSPSQSQKTRDFSMLNTGI